jgi:TRAP-type C4-dicarboxylate transport system permease small subunit
MRRSGLTDGLFVLLRASQVWASHLTLLVMVGALFLQIVARELRLQVDWTEELSRFAFIAMVFVSASYASQMGTHLRVSAFADFLGRWRPAGWLIVRLQFMAILTFDCLFFWYCVENLFEGLRFKNQSPAIGFNENLLFIAPLIGFGAAILHRLLSVAFAPPEGHGAAVEDLHP